MLWLFLPALAAAGFFSEHVEKYLDRNIDPCDDFYDHTCNAAINDSHLYMKKLESILKSVLEQQVSQEIRQFHESIKNNIANFPQEPMSDEDKEAVDNLKKKSGDNCWNEDLAVLEGMEAYDAYFRLQHTPHYNTLKKKMSDIFQAIKDILIKEFSEAPWSQRYPQLMDFLHNVPLVHMEAKDFELEKETQKISERYEECLKVASNVTGDLARKCISYAACPIERELQAVSQEFDHKLIWKKFKFQFNAVYSPNLNIVVPSPMFYTLEEDDLPFMLGSFDYILGHEIGHVFFNGQVVLSNSECLRQHMMKTCHIYLGEEHRDCWYDIIPWNSPVLNGDYLRLGDDASDWIGIHAGLIALKQYHSQIFNETSNDSSHELKRSGIIKKFYYANAIQWCAPENNGPLWQLDQSHSPLKVRVNGILSLFPEFTEVFGCKRGSRMNKAATCLPFAGVGSPTRRRQHGRRIVE